MKKRNLRFKSIKFLSLILAGLLLAACSANDELTGYDNDEERVEAMKAKVMKLADEYGLDIELGENFEKSITNKTLNLDSLKEEFCALAKLKGAYYLTTRKGTAISFDSKIERALRKKSTELSPRDVYSGSFHTQGNVTRSSIGATINISFQVQ